MHCAISSKIRPRNIYFYNPQIDGLLINVKNIKDIRCNAHVLVLAVNVSHAFQHELNWVKGGAWQCQSLPITHPTPIPPTPTNPSLARPMPPLCSHSWFSSVKAFTLYLLCLGVGGTLSDSVQCLNFAKKWFNSIFDSILLTQNSIQTIIQFKINSGDSIQN